MPLTRDNIVSEEVLARLSPERRALLQRLAAEQGIALPQHTPVLEGRGRTEGPLSFAQQRLWFLEQLEPGSPLYVVPCSIRMHGTVDVDKLRRSLMLVGEHQASLRTIFDDVNGEPRQHVVARMEIPFDVIDLMPLDDEARGQETARISVAEARKPFDLAHGPLVRVVLLHLAPQEYHLLLMMHHIISDGWSIGVLLAEWKAAYTALLAGRIPSFSPLNLHYPDYAWWQRELVKAAVQGPGLEYWMQQLAGATTVLDLVTDAPRPPVQSHAGSFELFSVPRALTDSLRVLSQREGATLFMTLTAAFMTLLHRYTGQQEFTVGTPVAGRTRQEIEHLIGFFINTLVLRANFAGDPSFLRLLDNVRTTVLDAFAHQETPFEMLVEQLGVTRDMSRSPLFQAMIVLNNAPLGSLTLPGVEMEREEIDNGTAKFDLVLSLAESSEGLMGKLEYSTVLFRRETVRSLAERFQYLLGSIVADPAMPVSRLDIEENGDGGPAANVRLEAPSAWSGGRLVHQEIAHQARQHSGALALACGEASLTYGELEERANSLARVLRSLGVGLEVPVAVYMERSIGSVISLLAILKAGGIYVPIDVSYPRARISYMLKDAGVRLVITSQQCHRGVPGDVARALIWETVRSEPGEAPDTLVSAVNGAYVIYTSGSTGDPKGVIVDHGAIAGHCFDMQQFYGLRPDDHVLQFASLTFDASLEQLFCALGTGAAVVMRGEGIWSIAELVACIKRWRLTVVNLPTPYWHQMVREWHTEPALLPSVMPRLVIAGGDVMQADAVAMWRELPTAQVRLLNAYGPTECVITATEYEIPAVAAGFTEARMPIGLPLPGRTVRILDPRGNPVPDGIPGEIVVAGDRLARGYLGKAAETAAAFVPDRFSADRGARLYRTGDRGRVSADGMVEFLGRVDDQIKVRGIRIEQGEIEAALRKYPLLKDAAVLMREDRQGDRRLTAYVVPRDGATPDTKEILVHARALLPSALVPSAIVVLPSLPLTAGGKLDRALLPPPEPDERVPAERTAPRTPIEQLLASLVASALGVGSVGITDNFFERGGHSMLAMQVVAQVRQQFKVDVPLKTLFETPTVEGLARAIAHAQTEGQRAEEIEQMLDDLEGMTDEEAARIVSEDRTIPGQGTANG